MRQAAATGVPSVGCCGVGHGLRWLRTHTLLSGRAFRDFSWWPIGVRGWRRASSSSRRFRHGRWPRCRRISARPYLRDRTSNQRRHGARLTENTIGQRFPAELREFYLTGSGGMNCPMVLESTGQIRTNGPRHLPSTMESVAGRRLSTQRDKMGTLTTAEPRFWGIGCDTAIRPQRRWQSQKASFRSLRFLTATNCSSTFPKRAVEEKYTTLIMNAVDRHPH